jgi:hypothetical protein
MNDDADMAEDYSGLGEREYIVTEVVKTSPPKGIHSGDWFRYTIGHGSSPISGVQSRKPQSAIGAGIFRILGAQASEKITARRR